MLLVMCVARQTISAAEFGPRQISEANTRLYLTDGQVVMGRLIEFSDDLVIIQVGKQVHTFEREEIDRIVRLESLGAGARTVTITEFPNISFLGGTVALGLLSWLQFETASTRDKEAKDALRRTREIKDLDLTGRAEQLQDKADRARLIGWTSAVLAVGSAGFALVPRKGTRREFPELSFSPYMSKSPGFFLAYNKYF